MIGHLPWTCLSFATGSLQLVFGLCCSAFENIQRLIKSKRAEFLLLLELKNLLLTRGKLLFLNVESVVVVSDGQY